MNDSFLTAALEYARAGFQVFQCEPGGKRPLAATAPHGCRDATTDVEKIRQWWTRCPDANIGLLAGDELVIVDLDVKDNRNGVADLTRILDAAGEILPECPTVVTPSGGKHLYFRCPAGLKFKARTGVQWTDPATGEPLVTGIDIRAGNAYVVAPPSAIGGMDAYQWERAISNVGELPELPKCLADVLPRRDEPTVVLPVTPGVAARENTGNLDDRIGRYIDSMDAAVAGRGGHRTTFGALCRLYQGFDLSEPELRWWASVYNERKCEPPWSECEMDHKISDVLKISPTGERGRLLREGSENRHPEVDLSRLLAGTDSAAAPKHADVPIDFEDSDDEESDEKSVSVEVPPVPDSLLKMPGFVDEVTDFCLSHAAYPIPAMAFGGALALQSFLCGRKVTEPGDLRTNLYLLTLAGASSGKDYARKVAKSVAREIGLSESVGDKFTSGPAIEDSLFISPNLLIISDEFDSLLDSIRKGKDTAADHIAGTLLTLYSSSNTIYDRRRKAGIREVQQIMHPHLTILGIATPKNYYESLTGKMREGGLFARMIVLDAGKRPAGQDGRPADEILGNNRVIETAKWWKAFQAGGNLADQFPRPTVVPYEGNARELIREFRRHAELEYGLAEDRGDAVAMASWGRAAENATRLSLLAACSADHTNLRITSEQTRWAVDFIDHLVRRSLYLADVYSADTDFDAKLKRAVQELAKWRSIHGSTMPMPEWKLRRKLGLSPIDFAAVVTELDQRRLAHFARLDRAGEKGRPHCGYQLF